MCLREQATHHQSSTNQFPLSPPPFFFGYWLLLYRALLYTRPSSLRVVPHGFLRLTLHAFNETYEWSKVNTTVEDILSGEGNRAAYMWAARSCMCMCVCVCVLLLPALFSFHDINTTFGHSSAQCDDAQARSGLTTTARWSSLASTLATCAWCVFYDGLYC